ncbi:SWF or SNF family helicase [Streptomyces carpaticus]|uniref:SWIM zinc finger family protein n=1 Tax=Streptomyces carpaticus TaxID=285558 RepID=UPI0031F72C51
MSWDEEPEQAAAGGTERVFAALPPARGRGFAHSWWGVGWQRAVEDSALEGAVMAAGRRTARSGAVGAVSVRPGRLTAVVQDRDGTGRRADVTLRRLSADEWRRLLAVVAGEAGHLAALLDREMPPHLVADAAAAGVDLLPGIGDLEPECECGEFDHCAHTAALCYQAARLLDEDPWILLLLRGRDEETLLREVRAASAPAREPAAGEAPAGVRASERYAARAAQGGDPPLPAAPPPVERTGTPPSLVPCDPDEVDPAALEFLAADAADRARVLLALALRPDHAGQPVPAGYGVWQDAVRLAAAGPPEPVAARLARGCRRSAGELRLAVRAWRAGGSAGLAVLEDPPAAAPPGALAQLAGAWADDTAQRPRLRASGTHWTVVGEGTQVRYGADGRWWPFRREAGRWAPAGAPSGDPAAALLTAREAAGADQGLSSK